MRSVRTITRGRVQGVGFRWFIQDAASAHGVAGWVRNRRDGSVEAELHGSDADVQAVLDAMTQGPPGAQVDEVAVSDLPAPTSRGFEIRPTA
ncbi:acylphosphatase [Microbacterium sp.]|uniref:acylphosphatase n=1 Tax=Microbacterium sp. TaxID=51671 RepID=UPI0027354BCE|nr:acylphosphatase [Microbacterium sp.]MDP3949162.1 acylphosphatase [Microbacterium sp.]